MPALTNLFPVFIFAAIFLVVMLTELIKKLDKKNVLKGYRVYIPLVLSFVLTWLLKIGNFYATEQFWFWWVAVFGFSVFAFEAILKHLRAKLDGNG